MQDIIGGELLFKGQLSSSSSSSFPVTSCTHNDFITEFLNVEGDRNSLRKQYEDNLTSIRSNRKLQRKVYSRQIKFERDTSQATLMMRYHELMSKVAQFNQLMMKGSQEMAQDIDVELMKEVVAYFSLIKQESNWAKGRRDNSQLSFHKEAYQAKIKKDLLLFSTHLFEESRGSIKLSYMEKDSTQFKRCEKAVLDNVGRDFRGVMKVLNVLKLDHTFLSSALHKAVSKNTNGKIKGLFAFVPKQNIYSLCTLGLHAQVLPECGVQHSKKPAISNLQLSVNKTLVNTDTKGSRKHGTPEIFRPSWFAIQPTIRAQNLDTEASSHDQPRSYGIARSRAEGRRIYNMRFSKKSVSPSFTFIEGGEDSGAFLALCRVYVVKLLTIDETLTTKIIEGALDSNYDAIFSTSTGEYSLLNPHHVLPEFIIQCSITADSNGTERSNENVEMPSRKPNVDFHSLFLHSKALSHLSCRSLAYYLSSLESSLMDKRSDGCRRKNGNTEILVDDVPDFSDRSSRIRSEQKIEIASIIAEATNEFFDKKGKLVRDLIDEVFLSHGVKMERNTSLLDI